MDNKRCILICAGEYISADLEKLKDEKTAEDYIIAVDGGLDYCRKHDMVPNCILGDFDSLNEASEKIDNFLKANDGIQVTRLKPEKDDTDTMSAIKLGLDRGLREFHIYCCMGGRRDHSMANLQALLYLCNREAIGYIHDNGSYFTAIKDSSINLEQKNARYVSIFAMGGNARGITLKNMKYELDEGEMEWDFPLGCSNEPLPDKTAYIEVKQGCLLIRVEA